MPLWLRYAVLALAALLFALLLAPLFPHPLDDVAYWGGWIACLVCAVLAVYYGVSGRGRARI